MGCKFSKRITTNSRKNSWALTMWDVNREGGDEYVRRLDVEH